MKYPLVQRFTRCRWSNSRNKIHDLAQGEEVDLPAGDRNNIMTSVTRLQEAYEHDRRYSVRKIGQRGERVIGWKVIRLK